MADKIFLGTGTIPGDWTATDNWKGSVIPVTGDDVFFNSLSAAVDVLTNISQAAVVLTSLTIDNGFEGTIGTSTTFLEIAATGTITIGGGEGNGSQRLNIDAGSSTATTINVLDMTSTGADQNFAPLRLKAANASTKIQINGETSNVSIFDEDDASGTIDEIEVILASNVFVGAGCTYTTFNQLDGTVELAEAQGTINIAEGTLTLNGSTAVTAVVQTDGTVISNTTGTTTAYTGRGGLLDTSQSALARTFTTLTKSPGFTFSRHSAVIVTNDNLDSAFQVFEIAIN